MSGHSKWSTIRRQKEINDNKKSKIYTKLSKQIYIAARQGGGDIFSNFQLRMAVDIAKSANMSSENIDRAIKKGVGADKNSSNYESITYGAYINAGASMLIDVLTDNRNRSIADIKMLVEKNGGQIVELGAISWQYKLIGLITMPVYLGEKKDFEKNRQRNNHVIIYPVFIEENGIEKFELKIMDFDGIEDINYVEEEGRIYIETEFEKLDEIRKKIEHLNYEIEKFQLIKKPIEEVKISLEDKEKNERLINILEDNDDVDNIWVNYI